MSYYVGNSMSNFKLQFQTTRRDVYTRQWSRQASCTVPPPSIMTVERAVTEELSKEHDSESNQL